MPHIKQQPMFKTQVEPWANEYLTMIEDCEAREQRLTDWERGFVSSLRSQIESGKHPSPKQIESLDQAWENATK